MINFLKLFVVFILTLISFGCSSDNDLDTTTIVGTWQLAEVYQSSGGPGDWSDVKNGYQYTFLENGNFSSSRFPECSDGVYFIASDSLNLDFSCDDFSTGFETQEGLLIESIYFESGSLFINPTYVFCVEGCNYKFKKIRD